MTTAELQGLLAVSGYAARINGEEVKVQTCWKCGNERWNMELNPAKGIWSCWACRNGGRLDALLSSSLGGTYSIPVRFSQEGKERSQHLVPLGDFRRAPAAEVPSAKLYLNKRGLPDEIIRGYGLSVCMDEEHALYARILFPMIDYFTGDLRGYTGRSYTGKKPKYLTSAPSKVICGYRTRTSAPCVLVEGFLDGIAVHRAGFQAAVLSGLDAPDLLEFAARIPRTTPLVLLLDGEAQAEASRLYWLMSPIRRALRVQLPEGSDPATFLPSVLGAYLNHLLAQQHSEYS